MGLDDEGVLELMAVIDLFSGFNKLMDGDCITKCRKITERVAEEVQNV